MFGIIILAALLSAATVPVNGESPSASQVKDAIDALYQLVVNAQYDAAVDLTIAAAKTTAADKIIPVTVKKLLESRSTANANVLSYAYKLWKTDKNIVIQYFPFAIKNIMSKTVVRIVNKKYDQLLKLSKTPDRLGDSQAFGDGSDAYANRLSWKFIPSWENNRVIFKINNLRTSSFLKLSLSPDNNGYRLAFGSKDTDTDRHTFYLEAQIEGGELVFFIVNSEYCQGLELSDESDRIGDRELRAHTGDICPDMDQFKWLIIRA